MNSQERRKEILRMLTESDEPISGLNLQSILMLQDKL